LLNFWATFRNYSIQAELLFSPAPFENNNKLKGPLVHKAFPFASGVPVHSNPSQNQKRWLAETGGPVALIYHLTFFSSQVYNFDGVHGRPKARMTTKLATAALERRLPIREMPDTGQGGEWG